MYKYEIREVHACPNDPITSVLYILSTYWHQQCFSSLSD